MPSSTRVMSGATAKPPFNTIPASEGNVVERCATTVPTSSQLVVNGGFETGSLSPWTAGGGAPTPKVSSGKSNSGSWSALLGTTGTTGTEPAGDSSVTQSIAIPASATTATLSFWYRPSTTDVVKYDWQEAQVRNTSGATLAQVFKTASNVQSWVHVTFDVSAYRGSTVQLWFNVHQDGYGDLTSMYLDDVAVTVS